jgi:hypothetical protein
MRDGSSGGADAPAEQSSPAPSALLQPQDDPIDPGQDGSEGDSGHPLGRRVGAALAWTAGAMMLFVLFLRIARTKGVNSDAANNALQAFDMLHGHLLLHGWIIGDATYYTFELPVIAIVEIFFGEHTVTMNVAEALIYLIVAAWAIAIAVTGSSGLARAARAAVVVTVLAAPALINTDMWIPLGIPDHTGTTVFLLIPCLLLDRVPARRWTAPLICVLLTAGQIGDVTVRYVAVPAIALACAYQILASRRLRGCDTANLLAAVVSLPLARVVRAAMLHAGSYVMVSPKTKLAQTGNWGHNAALSWGSLRELFGAQPGPTAPPAGTVVIFGYACLFIAVLGVLRVLWRWRTAHRADQVLFFAIAANMAVYIVSTLPAPNSPHDIVAVLPASAVLAARALVPDRITSRVTALVATGFALVAALMPLSLTATRAFAPPVVTPLAAWLEAHGLRYGLGGYWNGSAVTLATGGEVQVRPVHMVPMGHRVYLGNLVSATSSPQISLYPWETNEFWFDPTRHYANFVVINLAAPDLLTTSAARIFGKPVSTAVVGPWEILVYQQNILNDVTPAPLPPTS